MSCGLSSARTTRQTLPLAALSVGRLRLQAPATQARSMLRSPFGLWRMPRNLLPRRCAVQLSDCSNISSRTTTATSSATCTTSSAEWRPQQTQHFGSSSPGSGGIRSACVVPALSQMESWFASIATSVTGPTARHRLLERLPRQVERLAPLQQVCRQRLGWMQFARILLTSCEAHLGR